MPVHPLIQSLVQPFGVANGAYLTSVSAGRSCTDGVLLTEGEGDARFKMTLLVRGLKEMVMNERRRAAGRKPSQAIRAILTAGAAVTQGNPRRRLIMGAPSVIRRRRPLRGRP